MSPAPTLGCRQARGEEAVTLRAQPGYDADGELRLGPWVLEVTGLLDLRRCHVRVRQGTPPRPAAHGKALPEGGGRAGGAQAVVAGQAVLGAGAIGKSSRSGGGRRGGGRLAIRRTSRRKTWVARSVYVTRPPPEVSTVLCSNATV